MDPQLKSYGDSLKPEMVGKVVLFTTSNWSHRTVHALRKTLRENGIDVEEEHFFAHMLNIKGRKEAAKEFGKKYSA